MAKSSRASRTKRNRQNLRARVFGPVDMARTERLSAKLQEIAAKPKEVEMQEAVKATSSKQNEKENQQFEDDQVDESMDLDEELYDPSMTRIKKRKAGKKLERVQRRKRTKVKNQHVFRPSTSVTKAGKITKQKQKRRM